MPSAKHTAMTFNRPKNESWFVVIAAGICVFKGNNSTASLDSELQSTYVREKCVCVVPADYYWGEQKSFSSSLLTVHFT